ADVGGHVIDHLRLNLGRVPTTNDFILLADHILVLVSGVENLIAILVCLVEASLDLLQLVRNQRRESIQFRFLPHGMENGLVSVVKFAVWAWIGGISRRVVGRS